MALVSLSRIDFFRNLFAYCSDLFMQYSMFGSILTIGAMLGAVTSGRIADFVGRKGVLDMDILFHIVYNLPFRVHHIKRSTSRDNCVTFMCIIQAMRLSAGFCIAGWLAVYFSEVRAVKAVVDVRSVDFSHLVGFTFCSILK